MKTTLKFLFLLLFGALMASCISNKKIVYVQDYSQDKPYNYLADTTFNSPPDDYRIYTGDILHVKSDHPSLSQSFQQLDNTYLNEARVLQLIPAVSGFTVDTLGNITLPIIGNIKVEGLTIFEAQKEVEKYAKKVFDNPSIRIFMLNYFVTILGEVQRPGRYQVLNHRINIFEAMGLANDATDFASREEVKIIRNRNGVNHLFHVDLTDQNILHSPYFYLHPNDVLLVKPQKRKKYATRDVQNVINTVALTFSAITLYLLITQ